MIDYTQTHYSQSLLILRFCILTYPIIRQSQTLSGNSQFTLYLSLHVNLYYKLVEVVKNVRNLSTYVTDVTLLGVCQATTTTTITTTTHACTHTHTHTEKEGLKKKEDRTELRHT